MSRHPCHQGLLSPLIGGALEEDEEGEDREILRKTVCGFLSPSSQASLTFEDIAVLFSWEKWSLLDEAETPIP